MYLEIEKRNIKNYKAIKLEKNLFLKINYFLKIDTYSNKKLELLLKLSYSIKNSSLEIGIFNSIYIRYFS